MLNEQMAQRLIDRLSGTMKYNVNIMNEAGIIIASYDPSRVGSFHETAYRMMHRGEKIIEVQEGEKLLGTRPGINMAIENKNTVVGIVGITGNPDSVRPLALLLKAAIESLLEFELQQQELLSRTSKKDRFFQQMIYQEDRDASELEALAAGLGYRSDILRIPVYIQTEKEVRREEIARQCKTSDLHTKNDMLIRTETGNTLVFLHLRNTDAVCAVYRDEVELYLSPVKDYAQRNKIRCRYLVGSMQKELMQYREGYLHCRWLRKNLDGGWGETLFFYDHLYEYVQSLVPLTEQHKALAALVEQQSDAFWDNYVQVIGTMAENNNNVVKSSQALHMHKNTLFYRYNQLRERLNINPLENARDDLFARQLCYYLTHRD